MLRGDESDKPRKTGKVGRKSQAEERDRVKEQRRAAKAAEQELADLARQRDAIDMAMADPARADHRLAGLAMGELMKRRAAVAAEIDAAESAWLAASETVEALAA